MKRKEKTNFYFYFVDAKLRRFLDDSKKFRQFFFNLCGQLFYLWTNRGKRLRCCPNMQVSPYYFVYFQISSYICTQNLLSNMRHRIKSGKIGSYTPEKLKVESEEQEARELSEEVEEIFEEDSAFSNDDEALAAMEFYDSPDDVE